MLVVRVSAASAARNAGAAQCAIPASAGDRRLHTLIVRHSRDRSNQRLVVSIVGCQDRKRCRQNQRIGLIFLNDFLKRRLDIFLAGIFRKLVDRFLERRGEDIGRQLGRGRLDRRVLRPSETGRRNSQHGADSHDRRQNEFSVRHGAPPINTTDFLIPQDCNPVQRKSPDIPSFSRSEMPKGLTCHRLATRMSQSA